MSDFRVFENHHHENFSTALLAFSMRRSPQFALLISRFLLQKAQRGQSQTVSVEQVERDFPVRLKAWPTTKRVDLLIRGSADEKPFLILVEAKITAPFGETQLPDYREWLNAQPEELKVLLTLTKQYCEGDSFGDAQIRWADLRPYVLRMEAEASSDFERQYWQHFGLHLEDTMRTFSGFTSTCCDVLTLMHDVELFLEEILERLKVEKSVDYWQKDRAAYYLPELKVTIGFYWWHKDFWRETEPNRFCVWVDGQKDRHALASLNEIVEKTNSSVPKSSRDEYISQLTDKIRTFCGAQIGAA